MSWTFAVGIIQRNLVAGAKSRLGIFFFLAELHDCVVENIWFEICHRRSRIPRDEEEISISSFGPSPIEIKVEVFGITCTDNMNNTLYIVYTNIFYQSVEINWWELYEPRVLFFLVLPLLRISYFFSFGKRRCGHDASYQKRYTYARYITVKKRRLITRGREGARIISHVCERVTSITTLWRDVLFTEISCMRLRRKFWTIVRLLPRY